MEINKIHIYLVFLISICALPGKAQVADTHVYLAEVKAELVKTWPKNRTINIVFHGHSVPSGYFRTPNVNTLQAYPYLTLGKVKELYPTAVVNSITSTIGGENAIQGQKRFKKTVLNHNPDVLLIDYALNDRSVGAEKAMKAWEKMVKLAVRKEIPVLLLTPTPDLNEDILADDTSLAMHAEAIRKLAEKYQVGLVDLYQSFKKIAEKEDLKKYMAQNNHVNEIGHEVVANEIIKWFKN